MEKTLKLGIYRENRNSDSFVFVIRKRSGTEYRRFSETQFLNGWSAGGYRAALSNIGISGDLINDFLRHSITPTFLSRCGNSSPNRIKWATERKRRRYEG